MDDPPPHDTGEVTPAPENVCVCFHVPLVKLQTFLRQRRPRVASQLSECFGAGTGCGWCIPFLEQLFEQHQSNPDAPAMVGLSTEEYLARRREYLQRIHAARMQDQGNGEGEGEGVPLSGDCQ